MKAFAKAFAKKVAARITRENVKWLAVVSVAGWVMQGAIFGVLVVFGVENLPALVSAKVANWVAFALQCVCKARG